MASTQINTGHGASLTLATSSLSYSWTTIDIQEQTVPDVDTSHLATPSYRTYIPGDLIEGNTFSVEFQWDSQGAFPPIGSAEDCTITWPQAQGETGAATMAGSVYINSVKPPSFETDTLQTGTLVFKWDGVTPPAFTPATIV